MYFFTHLFVSKVLYQHFAEEVELDKRAFAYGNIKPDLPSLQRKNHTMENFLPEICSYANQLMDDEVTLNDFSEDLGVICHYVCDFFCYYHLNDEIHDRKIKHFLYELRLHFKLLGMNIRKDRVLLPSGKEPRRDLADIISEMRQIYYSLPQYMSKDIRYAFRTAVWVCESIMYYKKYSSEIAEEAERAIYSLLITEGGSV